MSVDSIDGAGDAHRIAADVRAVDLDAYQRTVRRLLVRPVVGADERDVLAAVRRWEPQLRRDLAACGRYALDVSAVGVRVTRPPLVLDPSWPARTTGQSRRPFDPRRYAYLCLVLASLLTSGSQVLLSELGRRLADDASRCGDLAFDRDEHAHRSAFVDVVHWLEAAGVIRLRDGSAAADLDLDALYDVEHELVHLLVPSLGLRDLAGVDGRFAEVYGDSRDERRARARHRVMRLVLERPCVLYADLADDERAWLQRNLARLADDVERLTGLLLERRREGVALVDVAGDGSDRTFPGPGSPAQLGLLLCERLAPSAAPERVGWPSLAARHRALAAVIDGARPGATTVIDPPLAEESDDGDAPAWPLDAVGTIVAELVRAYPGVRRDLREQPAEAARVAVAELLALDLVRLTTSADGRTVVVVTPAAARFRPVAAPATGAIADDQLDLFGGGT